MATFFIFPLLTFVYSAPLNQNNPVTVAPVIFNFTFTPLVNATQPLYLNPGSHPGVQGPVQNAIQCCGTVIVPSPIQGQTNTAAQFSGTPSAPSTANLLNSSSSNSAIPLESTTSVETTTAVPPVPSTAAGSTLIVTETSSTATPVIARDVPVIPVSNVVPLISASNVSSVMTTTPISSAASASAVPASLATEAPSATTTSSSTTVASTTTTVAVDISTVVQEVASVVNVNPAQAIPQSPITTVTPIQNNSSAPVGPFADVPAQDPQQSQVSFTNSQQDDASYNTAYQYINLTDSMAQTFTLNVSLPSSPTSLLTRLQLATNQMNYTSKLDVALQLTALAHNLMSTVDEDLTQQGAH